MLAVRVVVDVKWHIHGIAPFFDCRIATSTSTKSKCSQGIDLKRDSSAFRIAQSATHELFVLQDAINANARFVDKKHEAIVRS